MSAPLDAVDVTTASVATETLTSLIARVTRKLSRNAPMRWAPEDFVDAFTEALRNCLPLGRQSTLAGNGAADGIWEVADHVVKVLHFTLSREGEQMDVPLGAVALSHHGTSNSRIRTPRGVPADVTVAAEALIACTYNTASPGDVIVFPWLDVLEYYMLSALYEQRIDLVTMTDEESYNAGMTLWRMRADLRKAEIMSSLGLITDAPAPASKGKR